MWVAKASAAIAMAESERVATSFTAIRFIAELPFSGL
jgi:hypothetical protein